MNFLIAYLNGQSQLAETGKKEWVLNQVGGFMREPRELEVFENFLNSATPGDVYVCESQFAVAAVKTVVYN